MSIVELFSICFLHKIAPVAKIPNEWRVRGGKSTRTLGSVELVRVFSENAQLRISLRVSLYSRMPRIDCGYRCVYWYGSPINTFVARRLCA